MTEEIVKDYLTKLITPIIQDAVKSMNQPAPINGTPKDDQLIKYIPIQDIFKRKICSKPTFYAHVRNGEFHLYKFGNKSFVDKEEFEKSFKKVNGKK